MDGFLTSDGEKLIVTEMVNLKEAILQRRKPCSVARRMGIRFNTMNTILPEHLLKTVYIRGEAHTYPVQISHYALHIGQIIYIGKMLKEMSGYV